METDSMKKKLQDHQPQLDDVAEVCGEPITLVSGKGKIHACALADTLNIEVCAVAGKLKNIQFCLNFQWDGFF
jgi:hypothetical protein